MYKDFDIKPKIVSVEVPPHSRYFKQFLESDRKESKKDVELRQQQYVDYNIKHLKHWMSNLAEQDYFDREFDQSSYLTENPDYFTKKTVSLYVQMFKEMNPGVFQFDFVKF